MNKDDIDDFAKALAEAQLEEHPDEGGILVCMPVGPSPYDDNLLAHCSGCGCEIMHRPWTQGEQLAKLTKLCVSCAIGMAGEKH